MLILLVLLLPRCQTRITDDSAHIATVAMKVDTPRLDMTRAIKLPFFFFQVALINPFAMSSDSSRSNKKWRLILCLVSGEEVHREEEGGEKNSCGTYKGESG